MSVAVDLRAPDMPYVLFDVEVSAVEDITPRLRRVAFTAPDLDEMASGGFDQRVKLFFPLPGQDRPVVPVGRDWFRDYRAIPDGERPPIRTYTVRSFDRSRRTVWIEFVLHDHGRGPAAEWVARARPGDRLALLAPNAWCQTISGWEFAPPRYAEQSLLVGDEAALPAIGSILGDLAPHQRATVFLEVSGPQDVPPLPSAATVSMRYVYRAADPAGEPRRLLDAVRAAQPAGQRWYAWVAGESAMIRAVRRHLVRERGMAKSDVYFSGYWKLGAAIE